MPSLFAHAATAAALTSLFQKPTTKLLLLMMFCAVIPDADVLGFKFGVPYSHLFGHRGFTHSIFFSVLLGLLVSFVFYRKVGVFSAKWWYYVLLFSLATLSHAVFDAMTSGGLGVAFFAPFDEGRYFFPFRPIKVSPLSISQFFSAWGLKVLRSEFVWVFLPSFFIIMCSYLYRKFRF